MGPQIPYSVAFAIVGVIFAFLVLYENLAPVLCELNLQKKKRRLNTGEGQYLYGTCYPQSQYQMYQMQQQQENQMAFPQETEQLYSTTRVSQSQQGTDLTYYKSPASQQDYESFINSKPYIQNNEEETICITQKQFIKQRVQKDNELSMTKLKQNKQTKNLPSQYPKQSKQQSQQPSSNLKINIQIPAKRKEDLCEDDDFSYTAKKNLLIKEFSKQDSLFKDLKQQGPSLLAQAPLTLKTQQQQNQPETNQSPQQGNLFQKQTLNLTQQSTNPINASQQLNTQLSGQLKSSLFPSSNLQQISLVQNLSQQGSQQSQQPGLSNNIPNQQASQQCPQTPTFKSNSNSLFQNTQLNLQNSLTAKLQTEGQKNDNALSGQSADQETKAANTQNQEQQKQEAPKLDSLFQKSNQQPSLTQSQQPTQEKPPLQQQTQQPQLSLNQISQNLQPKLEVNQNTQQKTPTLLASQPINQIGLQLGNQQSSTQQNPKSLFGTQASSTLGNQQSGNEQQNTTQQKSINLFNTSLGNQQSAPQQQIPAQQVTPSILNTQASNQSASQQLVVQQQTNIKQNEPSLFNTQLTNQTGSQKQGNQLINNQQSQQSLFNAQSSNLFGKQQQAGLQQNKDLQTQNVPFKSTNSLFGTQQQSPQNQQIKNPSLQLIPNQALVKIEEQQPLASAQQTQQQVQNQSIPKQNQGLGFMQQHQGAEKQGIQFNLQNKTQNEQSQQQQLIQKGIQLNTQQQPAQGISFLQNLQANPQQQQLNTNKLLNPSENQQLPTQPSGFLQTITQTSLLQRNVQNPLIPSGSNINFKNVIPAQTQNSFLSQLNQQQKVEGNQSSNQLFANLQGGGQSGMINVQQGSKQQVQEKS